MDYLPNEIKLITFSFLSVQDLCNVKQVNSLFCVLGGDPLLYKRFNRRYIIHNYNERQELLFVKRNILGFYAPDTLEEWKFWILFSLFENSLKELEYSKLLIASQKVLEETDKFILDLRSLYIDVLVKSGNFLEAEIQGRAVMLIYNDNRNFIDKFNNFEYKYETWYDWAFSLYKLKNYSEAEIQAKKLLGDIKKFAPQKNRMIYDTTGLLVAISIAINYKI